MSIEMYTTKEGERRYLVRLRAATGKVYNRSFRTKREAETFAAREKADRSRGAWVDPRQTTISVKQYADRWMCRPDLRPRTRELYEGLLRLHIYPMLGRVELGKLSPSAVRQWRAALIASGLSNKAAARQLGISDNTVRHHLTSIFAKLETHDRLELVLYALRHALTRPIST